MKNESKKAMADYLAMWEKRADLITGKPGISQDFDSCYDALDSFPAGREHIARLENELDMVDFHAEVDLVVAATIAF